MLIMDLGEWKKIVVPVLFRFTLRHFVAVHGTILSYRMSQQVVMNIKFPAAENDSLLSI